MRGRYKSGQMNFTWLFAIFAGGAILVLAIFGAMRGGETQQYSSDTQIAKSIAVITDPLQAGYADGKYSRVSFRSETKIRNICFNDSFGRNELSVATRSSLVQEWNNPGGATSINNKYIFSKEDNIGYDYYVFSKPFEFPYKVTDLVFLTSEDYCFKDAPNYIEREVESLDIPNIETEDCSNTSTIVCFTGVDQDCDIVVYPECNDLQNCDSDYDRGYVFKDGYELNYIGNLMFAAIFAEKKNYLCNVDRILYRTQKIAKEYSLKIDLMNARGCSSSLKTDLDQWASEIDQTEPEEIKRSYLFNLAQDMDNKNGIGCNVLW